MRESSAVSTASRGPRWGVSSSAGATPAAVSPSTAATSVCPSVCENITWPLKHTNSLKHLAHIHVSDLSDSANTHRHHGSAFLKYTPITSHNTNSKHKQLQDCRKITAPKVRTSERLFYALSDKVFFFFSRRFYTPNIWTLHEHKQLYEYEGQLWFIRVFVEILTRNSRTMILVKSEIPFQQFVVETPFCLRNNKKLDKFEWNQMVVSVHLNS